MSQSPGPQSRPSAAVTALAGHRRRVIDLCTVAAGLCR